MRGMGQADPLQAKPLTDAPRSPPPPSSSGRPLQEEDAPKKRQVSDGVHATTNADKVVRPIYIKALNNIRATSKGYPSLTCQQYLECALNAGFNRAVMPFLVPGGSNNKPRYITSLDIGSSASLQRAILFIDASNMPRSNMANSLRESFQLAAHIGPDIVMLQPSYDERDLPQTVSAITNFLQQNKSAFLWILVPMSAESELYRSSGWRERVGKAEEGGENPETAENSQQDTLSKKSAPFIETWTFWKRLQTGCDYIPSMNACVLIEKQHIFEPKTSRKSIEALDGACFFDDERREAEYCVSRWLGDSCDTIMVHAADLTTTTGTDRNSNLIQKKTRWSRDDAYIRIVQKLLGGNGHIVVNFDEISSKNAGSGENAGGSPLKKLPADAQTIELSNEYSGIFVLTRELHADSARFPLSFPRDPPDMRVGYENEVQVPLQPMADNLADQVYEVFEYDPVKYRKYEQAIEMAMNDMNSGGRLGAPGTIRVLVAGAGRGPLVDRTIQAAIHCATGNSVKRLFITIIEKNLGAYYTLQRRLETDWLRQSILDRSNEYASRKTKPFASTGLEDVRFELLNIDMRKFCPKEDEKLDIIVSELLGSFACNELAPECLRGLERFLQPNGVMIPQEYSALARPVMANKLWKVLYRDNSSSNNNHKLDCMCVVRLHRYFMLTDSSATVFNYEHPMVAQGGGSGPAGEPGKGDVFDAVIEADVVIDFEALCDAELDGFAGSFDCLLYQKRRKDMFNGDDAEDEHFQAAENGIFSDSSVVLSTVPEHATENLISWFPAFMPLRQPVLVKKGDAIRLHVERKRGPGRVWYSWCLLSPKVMPMQNVGGKACHVGLYT